MAPDIEQLGAEIRGERDCGIVTFHVDAHSLAVAHVGVELVDAFVVRFGFRPLAGRWSEVDRCEAADIVQRILQRDLAYNAEIMARERAERLTSRFFQLFPTGARYFTNATFSPNPITSASSTSVVASWESISKSTFDTGVICADHTRIGIVWVQDED